MAGPAGAAGARRRWFVVAAGIGLGLLGAAFAVQLVAELLAPPGIDGHHDLLAFWSAGRLILEGRPGDLYDAAALTAIQRTVIAAPIGMNGYMPFINPPLAAVLFAPLAAMDEPTARVLWAALNAVVAVLAGGWIGRGLPGPQRWLAALLVATAYPTIHALAEGQWSIVLLGAGLVALEATRRRAWLVVGLALAVFWLKPQFVVLPLVGLAAARRWRAVAGALCGGAIVAAAGLPLTGLASYGTYGSYLLAVVTSHFTGAGATQAVAWQGDLATTEGFNGLFVGWFGQDASPVVNVLWAAASAAVLAIVALAARRPPASLDAPAARVVVVAGIIAVLLVNPNQFVQDCVLVFLALDAIGPLAPRWRWPAILATVAIADLTFLDLAVPVLHAFPLVLGAILVWTCRQVLAGRAGESGSIGSPTPAGGGASVDNAGSCDVGSS